MVAPTPTYDYASLTRQVKASEVVKQISKRFTDSSNGKRNLIMSAIACGLIVFVSIYLIIIGLWIESTALICIFVVTLATITVATFANTRFNIKLRGFASANNLIYLKDVAQTERPGLIFNEGYSRSVEAGFRSENAGFYELANYQYTTGSGKNTQVNLYGFLSIKLPRRLPNMVLDSRKNNLFGRISNLPDAFKSDQKLSLEGDFDKYFTLYAPDEYKQDALYVFTPEIMQLLIERVSDYDIEIVDDYIFLYKKDGFDLTSADLLQSLFTLASKIQLEIGEQTDYYSDERVGNRQANTVTVEGARLKSRVPIITIIIVILYIIFLIGFRHNIVW